jgi:hypothetical protein
MDPKEMIMSDESDPYHLKWCIPLENEPRATLFADFKFDYPIIGGWGYTREDAVFFSNEKANVQDVQYRDFISLEYKFAEHRTFEELIIFRGPEHSFSGIDFKLITQSLHQHDGRYYDLLNVKISALPSKIFEQLRFEYDESFKLDEGDARDRELDLNIMKKMHYTVTVDKDFWFDITDPYLKREMSSKI